MNGGGIPENDNLFPGRVPMFKLMSCKGRGIGKNQPITMVIGNHQHPKGIDYSRRVFLMKDRGVGSGCRGGGNVWGRRMDGKYES